MPSDVGDVLVVTAELGSGVLAVARSFLGARQLLGKATLLFHPRGKRFGRIDDPGDFAAVCGGSDQERRQAPINADPPADRRRAGRVLMGRVQVGGLHV